MDSRHIQRHPWAVGFTSLSHDNQGEARSGKHQTLPGAPPCPFSLLPLTVRTLNRLELVGETMRAALNALAREAPEWPQGVVPATWYERYGRRIEDSRMPRERSKRDAYAQSVSIDGFALLDALDSDEAPDGLRDLPVIGTLRHTWERHCERLDTGASGSTARNTLSSGP